MWWEGTRLEKGVELRSSSSLRRPYHRAADRAIWSPGVIPSASENIWLPNSWGHRFAGWAIFAVTIGSQLSIEAWHRHCPFSLHYLCLSPRSMVWTRREVYLPVIWMVCNLRKMIRAYETDAVFYIKVSINNDPLMNVPWYRRLSFSLFPIRFLRNICMSSWEFILKRWKKKSLSF